MKDVKERKVEYHTIIRRTWKTLELMPYFEIFEVLTYANKLLKKEKIYKMKEDKICLLQNVSFEKNQEGETIITGFFKSARHSFRPNLFDSATGEERQSPKRITEGDIEKTHFGIKLTTEEVFFLLEVNGNGISITQFLNYLSFYSWKWLKSKQVSRNYSLSYTKIGREDFLMAIKELKRTRVAQIYFNKSLLGSAALNFSNRTSSLKRDVMLTATAEKNESITETAIDFFNYFAEDRDAVSKVRILGKDDENNEVVLDTSFIERVEYATVQIHQDTGEVVTSEMITNIKGLLKNV